MTLTVTLHLLAGLGALGMGGGMLLREPARARNRSFALLCGALALWNFGFACHGLVDGGPLLRRLFLLGSYAAAPLGLNFAMALTGARAGLRRRFVVTAGLLVGVVWLLGWIGMPLASSWWAVISISSVGGVLAVALWFIGRHALALPTGPARRALHGVFWGGVIAVAGGLSDFLPRGDSSFLMLGPPAVLLFLLIVCAVIVRQRLLDLDLFFQRLVALIAGAATTGLIFFGVTRISDRFFVMFLTSIVVLAAAGPLGRLILSRARTAMTPADPVVRTLLEISRKLPLAHDRESIQRIVEEGRAGLPEDARFDVYLRTEQQSGFHAVLRSGDVTTLGEDGVGADSAIVRLLEQDRLPLTMRYVEREAQETRGARRELARRGLEQLVAGDLKLVVPLLGGTKVAGWIAAGGGLSQRYLTSEVAAALQAVGNQAVACLDRVDALETARRKESLAAVGELAAGLAHEVRNPTAAIRGAAQAMGPEATEPQRHEMLQVIEEETERLGRVVGEFLEYARPGLPRRESVDLAGLARSALKSARLSGKNLQIELVAKPDTPAARGDADQLRRAFENLIRNAWEATGDGGKLRIDVRGENDRHVSIRFEDNGPGIPDDEVPLLFRPFHSTKPGGTGLGLALIHRIVEVHQGELRVEGRPGVGAAITLVLPVAESAKGNS